MPGKLRDRTPMPVVQKTVNSDGCKMAGFTLLAIISIIFFLFSCNPHPDASAGKATHLIPKDTKVKNERDNKLFVFVGEKITITSIPSAPGDFDSGVKAKYLILQWVYGYYDKDTI